jgi:hypothetical protein
MGVLVFGLQGMGLSVRRVNVHSPGTMKVVELGPKLKKNWAMT